MVTFQFKTLIFKLQELSVIRPDLQKEMDIEFNKFGSQGYDIDSMQYEGDLLIVVMKKETKQTKAKSCGTK